MTDKNTDECNLTVTCQCGRTAKFKIDFVKIGESKEEHIDDEATKLFKERREDRLKTGELP